MKYKCLPLYAEVSVVSNVVLMSAHVCVWMYIYVCVHVFIFHKPACAHFYWVNFGSEMESCLCTCICDYSICEMTRKKMSLVWSPHNLAVSSTACKACCLLIFLFSLLTRWWLSFVFIARNLWSCQILSLVNTGFTLFSSCSKCLTSRKVGFVGVRHFALTEKQVGFSCTLIVA